MSEQTKPLHAPSTDAEWLKRKIELWERAEREARQTLKIARDQLEYYRHWMNDIQDQADD